MKESNIEKIVIVREDGTEEVVKKGMLVTVGIEGENGDLSMQFVNSSGEDAINYIQLVVMAYAQMMGPDAEDCIEVE